MAMKKFIRCVLLVVLWMMGSGTWAWKLSDFSTKGYRIDEISLNDWITIVFLAFFLFVIIYAVSKLKRIIGVTEDLQRATKELEQMENEEGALDGSKVRDSFQVKKLKSLYEKYRKETERLDKDLPGGVGCDIEEFFNEDNLAACMQDDKLNQIPGALTGIGMLGTFVGLTIGLSQFDFLGTSDGLLENLSPLMSSIKVAFITSIDGLVFSIIFNFFFRTSMEELDDSLVEFINLHHVVAKDDSHNQINKLLEVQESQKDLLKSFPDLIIRSIASRLEPLIGQMENTYDQACERLKEAQTEGMEALMDAFTKQLLGTLNSTAISLTNSITRTINYQEKTTEMLKGNIDSVVELTEKTTEINQLAANAVESIKEYTSRIDEYTKELQKSVSVYMDTMLDSIESFEEISDKHNDTLVSATDKLKEIAEKNKEYSDKLDVSITNVTEAYRSINADMKKTSEAFASTYKQLSDGMRGERVQTAMQYETIRKSMLAQSQESTELFQKNVDALNEIGKHIENTLNISVGNVLNEMQASTSENAFVEQVCKRINQSTDEGVQAGIKQINSAIDKSVARNIKKLEKSMNAEANKQLGGNDKMNYDEKAWKSRKNNSLSWNSFSQDETELSTNTNDSEK